jgi:adenosine deaminase
MQAKLADHHLHLERGARLRASPPFDGLGRWSPSLDEAGFVRTFVSCVEDLAATGCRYAEIRFNPLSFLRHGADLRTQIEMFRDVRSWAAAVHQIDVRAVVSVKREGPVTDWARAVAFASDYQRDGILGIDVSRSYVLGEIPIKGGPPLNDLGALCKGQSQRSFSIYVHCGWHDSVRDAWEAIDVLGAQRLGHGLAIGNDCSLWRRIARDGIQIEVCPTAAQRLAALPIDRHPVSEWVQAGIRVLLGSDHPLELGTDIAREHQLMARAHPEVAFELSKWKSGAVSGPEHPASPSTRLPHEVGGEKGLKKHAPCTRIPPPHEVEKIARALDFHYGITLAGPPARILKGHSRTNLLVESSEGRRYVLRLACSREVVQVDWECRLLAHLLGEERPAWVPTVLPGKNGRMYHETGGGQLLVLTAFVDGWIAKPPPGFHPSPPILTEIGKLIGNVNVCLQKVPSPWIWPVDKATHARSVLGDLMRPTIVERLSKSHARLVDQALVGCVRTLDRANWNKPIHGDIRFANLIFGRQGDITALLDWESAGIASHEMELALVLRNVLFADILTAGPPPITLISSLLTGFIRACHDRDVRLNGRELEAWFVYATLEECHYALCADAPELDLIRRERLLAAAERMLIWAMEQDGQITKVLS